MKVIRLDEIDSTNTYVKSNISELDNLTFVYTERQTEGRGRLDRKWVDTGDDNLFLTIVLKPDHTVNADIYPNFTQYLSVLLCMVIEEDFKISPQIKWPNDVLINGKKLAGILAEGIYSGTQFIGMALGIGINLNTTKENLNKIDKPATSLSTELGYNIVKEDFIKKLQTKFCLLYDNYIDKGFIFIKDEYLKRAIFLGKKISINVLDEIHTGYVNGITDTGALILNENNKENIYYIGDIL